MWRLVFLLTMVCATARAGAETLPVTGVPVTLPAGWTVAATDALYKPGDAIVDAQGHRIEIRIRELAGCAELDAGLAAGSDQAKPSSLTVPGYWTPIYEGATSFAGPVDGYHLCIERESSLAWVTVKGTIDARVRELLGALQRGSSRSSPPHLATERLSLTSDTALKLEHGTRWKYVREDEGIRLIDLRPGTLSWHVILHPGSPGSTCAAGSAIPEVTRTRDDEGNLIAVRLISCHSGTYGPYAVFMIAHREPSPGEISAIVDEVVTKGIVERGVDKTFWDRERLSTGTVGVALATSAPQNGGEVSAVIGRPVGLGFSFGVETGYSYHGWAAELQATAGLGIRSGSLGIVLGVGGIGSLLGEADEAAGNFTRHAGGMGAVRVFVDTEKTSFIAAFAATYGLNADQLRGEIGVRGGFKSLFVRVVQHGDLGEAVVARSVLALVGLGW
jgi:hypothetical protein